MAISRCDTFDFLIDIVPRDEFKVHGKNQMSMMQDEAMRYVEDVNCIIYCLFTYTYSQNPVISNLIFELFVVINGIND